MAGASINNANHDSRLAWFPPTSGIIKLNVDAAYSSESKIASSGLVVWDFVGSLCLCAVMKIRNIAFVLQAELQAIFFDLKIA